VGHRELPSCAPKVGVSFHFKKPAVAKDVVNNPSIIRYILPPGQEIIKTVEVLDYHMHGTAEVRIAGSRENLIKALMRGHKGNASDHRALWARKNQSLANRDHLA